MRKRRSILALTLLLGVAGGAGGQILAPPLGEVPLADVLEILQLERELIAVDGARGAQASVALHLGERVLWSGSRGRVGLVLTDQRILAVAVGSAAWQETRYQRSEQLAEDALLGDRVALIVTSSRAIGFDGGSGNLIELRFGPGETLVSARVGESVAVVVTDRRALGLSPSAGGFFESRLQARERVEQVSARANFVTVTTDRRVLIFRAPSGSWSERRLDLDS
ncbi:MAG: hypothetical protein OEM49_00800 [Myxococcales bacterium]|nr:hypothetical protein [Myxococcales bacterium]MDH5307220.1 hypothetical protein [Myxococcales bacterium]MDH5566383.1 hypothetical protein [Myxococcales bacterium]